MRVRVIRFLGSAVTTLLVALALPAIAAAVSVGTVTSPADGAVYYTGSAATVTIHPAAALSTDCVSGLWYLNRGDNGQPGAAYTAGGSVAVGQLSSTDVLFPGDYYYSTSVSCVSPAGDTYTTNHALIHVIAGAQLPPKDTTPPTGTLIAGSPQRVKGKLTATVTASEACVTKATVKIAAHGAKTASLALASKSLAAGKRAKLSTASLAATLVTKLKKALKDHHKVTATFKVRLTDAAGNVSKPLTKTIHLKL